MDREDLGRAAEALVEAEVRASGWHYIENEQFDTTTAPLIRGEEESLIRPDFSVAKDGTRVWVEVKGKTEPLVYDGVEQHGVNLRNWQHYKRVADLTDSACWLFIYEESTGLLLCRDIEKLPVADDRIKEKYGLDDPYGEDMLFFNKADFNVKVVTRSAYPKDFFGQDKLPLANTGLGSDGLFPEPPALEEVRGQNSASLSDFS
jgi:hypothetical protein